MSDDESQELGNYQQVSQSEFDASGSVKILPITKPAQNEINFLKRSIITSGMIRFLKNYYRGIFNLFACYLMFIAYSFYIKQDRICHYYLEKDCVYFYFLEQSGQILTDLFISSLIYGLLLAIASFNLLISRYMIVVILSVFTYMLSKHTFEASLWNWSYIYTFIELAFTILVLIGSSLILGLLFSLIKFKQKGLIIWVCLVIFCYISWQIRLYTSCSTWDRGLNGLKIEPFTINEQGEQEHFCEVERTKVCWYDITDGWFDSTWFYDCTKHKYVYDDWHKGQLRKMYNFSSEINYIEMPDISKFDQRQLNFNAYKWTIFEKARQLKSIGEIDPKAEVVLDINKMEYTQKVTRNESLVFERSVLRQQREQELSQKGYIIQYFITIILGRKLAKNVIIIYIDALSRARAIKKIPKTIKWFEDHAQKKNQSTKEDKYTLFQGLRFKAVADYTYHNGMALFYGVASNESNMYQTSHFSLTAGITNFTYVQGESNEPQKQSTKRIQYLRNLVWPHFLKDYKKAGYVTGHFNSYCSVTSIDQSPTLDFVEWESYDHEGGFAACDPNFADPDNPNNRYGGPYSVLRRCLYGKELSFYMFDYMKKFFNQYENTPKVWSIELIEAHEQSLEIIKHQDDKIYDALTYLEKNLEDSVFILVTDHGMHMKNIVSEYLGHQEYLIEAQLPMLLVLMDNSLLTTQDQKNLKANQQKMVTCFEVHHFLKYLVNTDDNNYHKDNSILSDKIPSGRNCKNIPLIQNQHCACF